MCAKVRTWFLQQHTMVLLMLLQISLCETKLLALPNVQVDLMSDVRNNGGALEIVR